MDNNKLKNIIEAAITGSSQPLSVDRMEKLFEGDSDQPTRSQIKDVLKELTSDYEDRGIELTEISSGFRFQVRSDYSHWISRLWEERPARYSRALMETLALIAYQQPITRGEIEEVRGVVVSTSIIRTLLDREWVKVVGSRDVPGRPALYGTTRHFLDDFNLKSLSELPDLSEIRDIDAISAQLDLDMPKSGAPAENEHAVQSNEVVTDAEDDDEEEPTTSRTEDQDNLMTAQSGSAPDKISAKSTTSS